MHKYQPKQQAVCNAIAGASQHATFCANELRTVHDVYINAYQTQNLEEYAAAADESERVAGTYYQKQLEVSAMYGQHGCA